MSFDLESIILKSSEKGIAHIRKYTGIELDYSIESIATVDAHLSGVRKINLVSPYDEEILGVILIIMGAYLGETFKRKFGGQWGCDDSKLPTQYFLQSNDLKIFPINWCLKHVQNGSHDSVKDKFNWAVELAAKGSA